LNDGTASLEIIRGVAELFSNFLRSDNEMALCFLLMQRNVVHNIAWLAEWNY